MPERFEIYIVYKRRYINTLPFLSFSYSYLENNYFTITTMITITHKAETILGLIHSTQQCIHICWIESKRGEVQLPPTHQKKEYGERCKLP